MEEKGYIYKITSPTGRIYIGQTLDLVLRRGNYKSYSCKKQKKVYNSLRKYGYEAHTFELIDIVDPVLINYWEMYYVRKFDSYSGFNENGLNLTYGGDGVRGRVVTDEQREKMSIAQKKRPPFTEETRRKISEAGKGKKMPDSVKSAFEKYRRENPTRTEEQKAKISATLIKNYNGVHHASIEVLNLQTGIFYSSISDAAKSINMRQHTLKRKLNGERYNNTDFLLVGAEPEQEVFNKKRTKKLLDTSTNIVYDSIKEACRDLGYNESTVRVYLNGFNRNTTNLVYL